MLNYKQALDKILKHSFVLDAKPLSLRQALGLVVAKDVFSLEPFPSFDNSAVDGYAISPLSPLPLPPKGGEDLGEGGSNQKNRIKLKVIGEIRAGEYFKDTLKHGEAIRIFTGAPVPKGTQAVVMQEHTERVNGSVSLLKVPRPHDNIRFRGEDFDKGKLLIRKGSALEPTHLGLLGAMGYKKVPVHPSPKVAILATGSELLKKGEKLRIGKIYDSNTTLLEALVRKMGGVAYPFSSVGDQPEAIRAQVRRGLQFDLFLISGGVSVGQYDHVKEILGKEGVQEIFWKVDIKPGKPLFFGRKDRTLVFGLPGNPVSVFVTFMEFVKPAIEKMMRRKSSEEWVNGHLTHEFQNGSRLHFVRVHFVRNKKGYAITPLKGQGSHLIGSLAASNGILKVEADRFLGKNECVSVKIF